MPAILTVGLTTIRDLLKTGYSPIIAVSDDTTAFAVGQTTVNPGAGTTVVLAKTATISNVSASSYDATIQITYTGDTTIRDKAIQTIAACTGTTAAPVAQSRSVRAAGLGIGVVSGDTHTLGLRITDSDTSP